MSAPAPASASAVGAPVVEPLTPPAPRQAAPDGAPQAAPSGAPQAAPDGQSAAPAQPGPPTPPGQEPGSGQPGRPVHRRGLLLVSVVVAAAMLGAAGALVLTRDDPATKSRTSAPADAGKDVRQPYSGATPSGAAGFGQGVGPSASPGSTPSPGADGGSVEGFSGPRNTLPGAAVSLRDGESWTAGLARADRTYGPLRMVRVFLPGLPPSWKGSRPDQANRTVVVSFRGAPKEVAAGRHDAKIAAWFKSIPQDQHIYWSYYHEPEDDVERGKIKAADFRAAWRRVAGLADRARNPKLHATLILMCWTAQPKSKRNFNDYYPGSDVIDVLGWDCYNTDAHIDGKYSQPENIYSNAIALSKSKGKPFGIAETGSQKIRGDAGAGRAAWLRSAITYLNKQKPLWVSYFDSTVGGNFLLTDKPSQTVWRSFCQANPG